MGNGVELMDSAEKGMGFHRFLVWFLIPVEAAYLLWTAVSLLFGIGYRLEGVSPAQVYEASGMGLWATDAITAFTALAVSVVGIVTELALLRRRAYGPVLAQAFFIAIVFVSLVYGIGLAIVFQDLVQLLEALRYQVANAVIGVACFTYYRSRMGSFTEKMPDLEGHPLLRRFYVGFIGGATALGTESEGWAKNKKWFQFIYGALMVIFILGLVLWVVVSLNSF